MRTIERATMEDLPEVLRLMNDARAWLHTQGINQWPHEFTADNVGHEVAMAEMWLVKDDGRPVATVRATGDADPAFWTPDEAADQALYVSRFAIDNPGTHSGLGELLARWVIDRAYQLGYKLVRLDARRDNLALHAYYSRRGWEYIRTVDAAGRFSGALFERPAAPDYEARAAFATPPGEWLDPGTPVIVEGERGVIVGIHTPYIDNEHQGSTGMAPFMPGYEIRLADGRLITAERRLVSAVS